MKASSPPTVILITASVIALWLQRLAMLCLVPAVASAQTIQEQALFPPQACVEFSEPGDDFSPFWRESDCVHVWTSWAETLPASLHRPYPDRQMLHDSAAEMRRRGNPCLVGSKVSADGVGSATMRHLAAWVFAEEVGCDWVTPDWGMPSVDEEGSSLYCHTAATLSEIQGKGVGGEGLKAMDVELEETMVHRCALTNWLQYFNLAEASVEPPSNGSFRVIEADTSSTEDLRTALEEVQVHGFDNLTWDRLHIVLSRAHASNYLAALGSWDEWKREVVRNTLREFRENFHKFPRPWYNQTPECQYESAELNFALHVRMGDRSAIEHVTFEYFQMLDAFMATVTQIVRDKGHAAPTFHVFSETLLPCPTLENGTFHEFPVWPVEMDQVPACLTARTPVDCAEKRAGAKFCQPDRSGDFRVQDRPLILHVGQDVANALSCMIQADGILMGCSTFGQLAGVLNGEGISFFSTSCSGLGTAVQYKTIPPLAVAERGYMWVPVEGSWRNPVLRSTDVFVTALEALLRRKGMVE